MIRASGTRRLRRLDELLLAQRRGAADDAGEPRPEEESEDDGDPKRVTGADVDGDGEQHREAGRVSTRSVSRMSPLSTQPPK